MQAVQNVLYRLRCYKGGDWFLLYRYVVGDGFCYLQTMFPLRSS